MHRTPLAVLRSSSFFSDFADHRASGIVAGSFGDWSFLLFIWPLGCHSRRCVAARPAFASRRSWDALGAGRFAATRDAVARFAFDRVSQRAFTGRWRCPSPTPLRAFFFLPCGWRLCGRAGCVAFTPPCAVLRSLVGLHEDFTSWFNSPFGGASSFCACTVGGTPVA